MLLFLPYARCTEFFSHNYDLEQKVEHLAHSLTQKNSALSDWTSPNRIVICNTMPNFDSI